METLVIPLLGAMDSLDLSLIQIHPNRVNFVEGELMEAKVVPMREGQNFNYAVSISKALMFNIPSESVFVQQWT